MGFFLLPPGKVSYISERGKQGGPLKEARGGRRRVMGTLRL